MLGGGRIFENIHVLFAFCVHILLYPYDLLPISCSRDVEIFCVLLRNLHLVCR